MTREQALVAALIRRHANQHERTEHYQLGAFETIVFAASYAYDEDWADAKARVSEALEQAALDTTRHPAHESARAAWHEDAEREAGRSAEDARYPEV